MELLCWQIGQHKFQDRSQLFDPGFAKRNLHLNKDSVTQFPKARKDQLIVKEVDSEVLVYDLRCDKAHCLNSTAGLVWKYCDGNSSVAEIAKSLGDETHTVVDEQIVLLALDQFEKFRLLEDVPIKPAYLAGMKRRELVRRIGIGALALPLVISITAPTALAQASGTNICCVNPSDCNPGLTCRQSPTCIGISPPSTKACLP